MSLHSLNNEGTEGNQTMTRMVTVYVPKEGGGSLESVNAVSGDMFKHIFAEHLREEAIARELPLSEGAKAGSANRYNQDFVAKPDAEKTRMTNTGILDDMIGMCTVSDICGLLVTEGKKSAARKSVAEFGWVTGIPDHVRTDSFFHVKYDKDRGAGSGQETLGQAIFHRPASSGAYAAIVHLELARIGFNDLTLAAVLDDVARASRQRAALTALLHTFVNPQGAHRNTQNPHITGFEGFVAWSTKAAPAPLVSALSADFVGEAKKIGMALDEVHGKETVEVKQFKTLSEFASLISERIKAIPQGRMPSGGTGR